MFLRARLSGRRKRTRRRAQARLPSARASFGLRPIRTAWLAPASSSGVVWQLRVKGSIRVIMGLCRLTGDRRRF